MSVRQEVLKLFPWLSCEHHEDVVKFIESRTPAPAPKVDMGPCGLSEEVKGALMRLRTNSWRFVKKGEPLSTDGPRADAILVENELRRLLSSTPPDQALMGAKEAYNNGWYTCPDEPSYQENPTENGCGKCLECTLDANSSTPPDPSSAAKEAVIEAAKKWRSKHNGNRMLSHEDDLSVVVDRLAALGQEKS